MIQRTGSTTLFKTFRQFKISSIILLLILLVAQTWISQTGERENASELNLSDNNQKSLLFPMPGIKMTGTP
jgi:hypothetical protein